MCQCLYVIICDMCDFDTVKRKETYVVCYMLLMDNKPKYIPNSKKAAAVDPKTVIPYKRGSFCFTTKQCNAFLRRPARRPPLLLLQQLLLLLTTDY